MHVLGWCFWINLPIGGITFFTILFFVTLPAQKKQTKYDYSLKSVISRFDLIGTAIFIPANICLLLALQWGGVKYAWGQWRIILLLVLFAVLLVLWLASQYVQGNKATLPLATMRQRSLASGAFYSFCCFAAFFLIIYYVPIWFQAVRGVSAYTSGVNLLTASAAMAVAVISSGFLVGIFPRLRIIRFLWFLLCWLLR